MPPKPHLPGEGSRSRYMSGCRCSECRAAHSKYNTAYVKRHGYPKQKYRYRGDRSKRAHLYTPIKAADVTPGLTWKRSVGKHTHVRVEYSFGNVYKRVTDTRTGDVIFYRLLAEAPATPAERIDAEPQKSGQVRYRLGSHCWFVDNDSRWYLCVVVDRKPLPQRRITIRPVTGRDAEREKDWPYGGELEFPAKDNNPLFLRLRPLKARRP